MERSTATNYTSTVANIVVAPGRSPRTATIHFSANPNLRPGYRVTIAGSAATALNSTYPILSASSTAATFETTAMAGTYTDSTIVSSLLPLIQAPASAASYVTIRGLWIDGNNKTGSIGIYSDTNDNWTIQDNSFTGFPAGSAAITGGENIDWHIEHNTFSHAGLAIAMQNNYGTIANGYYGCNVCRIERNQFYGGASDSQGNIIGGIINFNFNDIEARLGTGGAPAEVVFGDSLNDGFYNIQGNYMEDKSGAAAEVGFQFGYGAGSGAYNATGNQIGGGGAGIGGTAMIAKAVDGPLTITGNTFQGWLNGVCFSVSGAASADINNSFIGVTNPYPATGGCIGIDNNDVPASTNNYGGQFAYLDSAGWVVAQRALVTAVVQYTSGTNLDLHEGNQFDLTYGSPTTVATVSNARPGMRFTIKALNGNATLTNSTFNLLAGANYTMRANQILQFEIDQTGAVHEVGSSSTGSRTICSGTVTLGTSAIPAGTAARTVTAACTGLLSTDNIMLDFNSSPLSAAGWAPSANGILTIVKWPSANTINVAVVNNTRSSITPGPITLNYRVVR